MIVLTLKSGWKCRIVASKFPRSRNAKGFVGAFNVAGTLGQALHQAAHYKGARGLIYYALALSTID
jgi:hypothetical protein